MGDEKENSKTKTGDRVKKAIDDIKEELETLEAKGVDVGDAKAFVKHAALSLEANDLKKAVLLSVQAKEFMARAKKTLDIKRDELPSKKVEKKEEKKKAAPKTSPPAKENIVDTVPSNIVDMNERVGNFIKERKLKGIDMSEAEGLYELSQKEIRLKEYKYLEEHLKKAIEIAERLEKEYNEKKTKELEELGAKVQEKIVRITNLGGSTTEIMKIMAGAKGNINKFEFVEANEQIETASTRADEIMDETLRGLYKDKITNIKKELNTLREDTKRDFPGLAAIIRSGILALKEARYKEIDGIIKEFHKSKDNDMKLFRSGRLIDGMKELEKDLIVITGLDIDKGDADELMFSAREGLMKERFDEVSNTLDKLRELVENIKTIKAKELTEKVLAEVDGLFDDLNEKDVDISESEAIAKNSVTAMENNDFLESYRYALEAKVILLEMRDSFLDVRLGARVEELNNFLEGVHSIEYVLPDKKEAFQSQLSQIAALLEKKKYLDASKLMPALEDLESEISKKRNNHDKVQELIQNTGMLKETTLELQLDIDEEEAKYAEVEKYLDDFQFAEAIPLLEEINRSFQEKVTQRLSESAALKYETAIKKLEEYGAIIEDIDTLNKEITKIRELIEQARYNDSIEISTRVLEDIENIRARNVSAVMADLFKNAQRSLEQNFKLGIDVTKCESLLYRAKIAFEKIEIEPSKELIREAEECVFKGRWEHFDNEISTMEDIGIDVTAMKEQLVSGNEAISKGDLDTAGRSLETLPSDIETARTDGAKAMAKTLITRVKGVLTEVSKLNIALEEEKDSFKEAIGLIKEQKFIEGCKHVLHTEEKLLAARKEFYQKAALASMEELKALIIEGAKMEVEVTSIEDMAAKGEALFISEKYEETDVLSREVITALEEMMINRLLGIIDSEMEELGPTMEEARQLDINMNEEEGIISSFDDLKDAGEHEKVIDTIREISSGLRDRIKIRIKENHYSKIEEAKGSLTAFEEKTGKQHSELRLYQELFTNAFEYGDFASIDPLMEDFKREMERQDALFLVKEDNQRKIEEAREDLSPFEEKTGKQHSELRLRQDLFVRAFEYGDFASIDQLLEDFKREMERQDTLYLAKTYTEKLSLMEEEISLLEKIGIGVSPMKEFRENAREAIQKHDFDNSEKNISSLGVFLDEARTGTAKELAKVLIGETKELFSGLKDSDYDLVEIKERFKETVMLIKKEQYVEGCENTLVVKDMIKAVERDHVGNFLAGVREIVDENEKIGAEVIRSEAFLYKALDICSQERYQDARELGDQAKKSASIARKNFYSANVTLFLSEVQDLLKETAKYGLDTTEIEAMVATAETHFKNDQLEEGNTIAYDAWKKIKNMIDLKLEDILNQEISDLMYLIEDAESYQVELDGITEAFDRINELKENEQYNEARERIKEIQDSIENDLSTRKKEIYEQRLAETEKEFSEMTGETGKEYPELDALMASAVEAVKQGDYEAADTHLAACHTGIIEAINRSQQEEYQEELNQLETIISEMTALGLEIPDEVRSNLEDLKKKV